jgi:hypothetical protein
MRTEQSQAAGAAIRAQWWPCCSADAAMLTLDRLGAEDRKIKQPDSTTEHWEAPELPA